MPLLRAPSNTLKPARQALRVSADILGNALTAGLSGLGRFQRGEWRGNQQSLHGAGPTIGNGVNKLLR